jgi:hypothetical protein
MKNKNLMFQVSIPPNGAWTSGKKRFEYSKPLYDYGNDRAKNYAEKWGADYFCLKDTRWLGDRHAPAYHKLYVYKLFEEGYTKIAFVDSDAAITKICPNIWNFNRFSAVPNHHNSNKIFRMNQWHKLKAEHTFFSSGTILFTRDWYQKTRSKWDIELPKYLRGRNFCHDQSVFNAVTSKYYGPYNQLGPEWGAWWSKRSKYITQFNGVKATREFCAKDFEKWEKTLKNN